MGSTASFRGSNYGSQIGANYGSVKNEFHLLGDLDDKLSPVLGAAFDSFVDQHENQCFPGTRTDILSQISEWASSPKGRCIFWLNGIAGTGKSTISRTMAKSFSLSESLGASFFFKRGEGDRGNASRLFPTIARQLAISIPDIAPVLQETVRENPGIITKTMREQFEKLLLQPLHGLKRSKISSQAIVIVIDALDECEGDSDIRLILQLLPQLQNLAATRIRVLLTSRPDLPIRLGFLQIADGDHRDFLLHDIPLEVIKHDISRFFDHRLKEIRTERFLSSNWPGDECLQKLVELSVPLFIFAATICRIFEEPDWDPIDSLTEILTRQNDQSKLDRTYLPVLGRLLDRQHGKQKEKLVSEFQQVIGAIVTLESPLSVPSLGKLLDLPERLVRLRLDPLHSVLRVPDNETVPVRLFHLSFREFLLDPETRRKTPLGIKETEIHYRLAKQCLLMCQRLQKNICGLPSYGTLRTEIDRQTIDSSLPPEVQYACRYWVYHLVKCTNMDKMIYGALLFLQRHFLRNHFLYWVEAMSLLGLTSDITGILDQLQTALLGNDSSSNSDLLHEAQRFILKNHQIIDLAPLQIYCTGLIFAPQKTIIRAQFEREIPTWLRQLPRVEERWGPELQTLEGHSYCVETVTFSPDGQLLASGSQDHTVRLWDSATGALIQTLEGHSATVKSVVFSPDGRLLASGSQDSTVQLWDPATGVLTQTLEGYYSGAVVSLVFSPDSRLLASGLWDNTVRLWDLATGALKQTLEGHLDRVSSVAFSSDGRLLASGSQDSTVKLWDPATGALNQTLEGHLDRVLSVAFSPDGRLLASGSFDSILFWDLATGTLTQTLENYSKWASSLAFSPDGRVLACDSGDNILLWDLATGTLIQTLEGHLDMVLSVAFSPDGGQLVSSSHDNTVRLWEPATEALTLTREGHLGAVNSVAFSPDSRLLASGSQDHTVRLWDPATGALIQTLEGHSATVESVVFSPDGRLLASGSQDSTVQLWDPVTGLLTQTLEGHSGWVTSVVFSPDGQLLASGSHDNIVQLWNPATGALTQTLKGHSNWVTLVVFSPDGQLLASGSQDHTVRLWDTATGILTQTLEGHSKVVASVAFSPDSRLLASGSYDNTVRIWDPTTGSLSQTLESHSDSVGAVAFSPDGRLLASGSHDHTVRLWELATGMCAQSWNTGEMVDEVHFSDDGFFLHTESGVIDIQSIGDLQPLQPHHANVDISIAHNQWIKLDGEKVLWLPVESRPSCFKVNGNTLAMGHFSGRVSFIGICI